MVVLLCGFLLLCILSSAAERRVTTVNRHYQGDIYELKGNGKRQLSCVCGANSAPIGGPQSSCHCQCVPAFPAFRDDSESCVQNIEECPLADFVSASGVEKIPYVYVPLRGQLVHPTAEVALLGINSGGVELLSPVCVVTKGRALTNEGWRDLVNSTSYEPPFRLYRDRGKTYIQWVGDERMKRQVEGRVVLVSLVCRDAAQPTTSLFHPCASFRVAGSLKLDDESTYALTSSADSSDATDTQQSATIAAAVSSAFVVIAVGVTIYFRIRRRRKHRDLQESLEKGTLSQKRRISSSQNHSFPASSTHSPLKSSLVSSEEDSDHEDLVDLSKNSKVEKANQKRLGFAHTTALVHENGCPQFEKLYGRECDATSSEESSEKESCKGNFDLELITNGCENEDLDSLQARKKLYFNPAYFEPELLQEPPPGALEFLSKIREMITVAKGKMRNKTFQPSLIDIPEEDSEAKSGSRTPSSAGRSSLLSVNVEEPETRANLEQINDENEKFSDYAADSLENSRTKSNASSRNSTLAKNTKKVNNQSQNIVEDIMKSLDLKPKLPERIYAAKPKRPTAPKPNVTLTVQKTSTVQEDSDNDMPELIKPSMIRNVLKENKRKPEIYSFENFRQEMKATFIKMKKIGEAISPKSTLNRNKEKIIKSPFKAADVIVQGRVHKWLQTFEDKEISTNPSISKKNATATNTQLPTLFLEKENILNSKLQVRSNSFNDVSNDHLYGTTPKSENITLHNEGRDKSSSLVMRSKSWQDNHKHYYYCKSKLERKRISNYKEEYVNYCYADDENDAISDILSQVESKVPKIVLSDSDSNSSDSKSLCRDSLEYKRNRSNSSNKVMHYLSRDDVVIKNATLKKQTELTSAVKSNKICDLDDNVCDNHTYEEIALKRNASLSEKLLTNVSEHPFRTDEDTCSIYSDPDSLISEIHLPGKLSSILTNVENGEPIYSGSILSIPVDDNVSVENYDDPTFDQDTLDRLDNKVKHNDKADLNMINQYKSDITSVVTENMQDIIDTTSESSNYINNSSSSENEYSTSSTTYGNILSSGTTSDCSTQSENKLKTFKDYKKLENKNSNQYSFGSGIMLNYRCAIPDRKETEDKPPLPPKHSNPSLAETPVLPPKGFELKPPLPTKLRQNTCFNYICDEPPKLPEKLAKRKNVLINNNSLFSSETINASNTENEILNQPLLKKENTTPHKQVKNNHFLEMGNTAEDHELDFSSVPNEYFNSTSLYQSSIFDSLESDSSEKTYTISHDSDSDLSILTETMETSKNDKWITDQFILSNGNMYKQGRNKSSTENLKTEVLEKLVCFAAELEDDAKSKGLDITGTCNLKLELEKHFKHESDSADIQKAWKTMLELKEKLHENDKVNNILHKTENQEKQQKQEDSGYQSTDSSDSSSSSICFKKLKTETVNNFDRNSENFLSFRSPVPKHCFKRSNSLQHFKTQSYARSICP